MPKDYSDKPLTPKQWKQLNTRLKKKIKDKQESSGIYKREDIKDEINPPNNPSGRPPSTPNGIINKMEKQAATNEPPGSTVKEPQPNEVPGSTDNNQYTCITDVKTNPTHNSGPSTISNQVSTEGANSANCGSLKRDDCGPSKERDCGSSTNCGPSPAVPARSTSLREAPDDGLGLYSPERNAFDLLKQIQAGNIETEDLTMDERVIVVRAMRQMGRPLDQIAAMIRVSRRTVERDIKKIKQMDKHALMSYELEEFGGEIHAICMHAAREAVKSEKYKSAAQILESMTNMLQSMGLVYKAPAKSQVAAMVGVAHTQVGQRAYQQYQSKIEDAGREQFLEVMNKLMEGVANNEI